MGAARLLRMAGVWALLAASASVVTPASRFVNYAFLGGGLVAAITAPGRDLLRWSLPFSATLAALSLRANDDARQLLLADVGLCGALVGMGVLAAFALRERAPRLTVLGAAGIPAFMLVQGWFRDQIAGKSPFTYDAVLLALDRALGFDPAYTVGRWFVSLPLVSATCALLYAALPVQVALVYAAAVRGKAVRADPVRLLLTCAALQLVGAVVYRVVPAVGPRYVFDGFPYTRPEIAPVLVAAPLEYARNAVPSVHFALALVLLRASRGAGWVFASSVGWTAAIGLATLGMGEHYLIDLVVAVPVAFGMEALWERRGFARPLLAAAVTLAWIGVVRTAMIPSAATAWIAMIATIVLGAALALAPRSASEVSGWGWRDLRGGVQEGTGRR